MLFEKVNVFVATAKDAGTIRFRASLSGGVVFSRISVVSGSGLRRQGVGAVDDIILIVSGTIN